MAYKAKTEKEKKRARRKKRLDLLTRLEALEREAVTNDPAGIRAVTVIRLTHYIGNAQIAAAVARIWAATI